MISLPEKPFEKRRSSKRIRSLSTQSSARKNSKSGKLKPGNKRSFSGSSRNSNKR